MTSINFPSLQGSAKQVAWAEDIREKVVSHVIAAIAMLKKGRNGNCTLEVEGKRIKVNLDSYSVPDIEKIEFGFQKLIDTKLEAKYWIDNRPNAKSKYDDWHESLGWWLERSYYAGADAIRPAPDAAVLGEVNAQKIAGSEEDKRDQAKANPHTYATVMSPWEALRQEHIRYCQKHGTEHTAQKAWVFIESQAWEDKERVEFEVGRCFSPVHRKPMLDFCLRYQEMALAKLEAEEKAQAILQKHLDAQRPWVQWMETARDDFEYEDAENSMPSGEIVVKPDCIQVKSLRWTEGFKSRLPKGGKYQGKGSGIWEYPLSVRSQLEKTGLPIIKYPGVE